MKIGFLGGGNISTAIINGLINSNNFQKANFKIVVKTKKSCEKWQKTNFSVSTKWESLNECQVIILALLPQDIYQLQTKLKINFNNKIIISIASGVTIKKLKEIFNNCYVARIMTSTSCQFNQAKTMICTESDEIAKIEATAIFKFCGSLINLSETKIHEYIAIYGSAAAYIYYWLQPLMDKALKANISLKDSKEIIVSLLLGTANTMLNSDLSLEQLINNICVSGGTTIAAIDIFNKNNVQAIINEALTACTNRSKILEKDKN